MDILKFVGQGIQWKKTSQYRSQTVLELPVQEL